MAVDSANNVYVADAGNRRLLKLSREGKVDILLRTDPPFFPNGVVAGPDGSIYVLEMGFTLPSTSSGPRVRKISPDGKSTILATVGAETDRAGSKTTAGSVVRAKPAGSILSCFGIGGGSGGEMAGRIGERTKYGIVILGAGFLCAGVAWWQRRRRQ